MTDRLRNAGASFPSVVRWRLGLTRAALVWEQLWPALVPPLSILAVFAAVVLLDLLPALPGWMHTALLTGFAVAFAVSLWHGLRRLRWPEALAAQRRLETASGVAHRPLTTLRDRPALHAGDGPSERLWQAHQRRAVARLAELRPHAPHPGVPGRDQKALRAAALLVLLVALVIGGGDAEDRFTSAFAPSFAGPAVAAVPLRFDVWIAPPQYTRLAPIYLAEQQSEVVRAPAGSELLAQVHGIDAPPQLRFDGAEHGFERVGGASFSMSMPLEAGVGDLTIHGNGSTLAEWALQVVPDGPPTVAFGESPTETERQALQVAVAANDDYGLSSLALQIALDEAAFELEAPGTERLDLSVALPSIAPTEVTTTRYHDLTPHVWAGVPVRMRLVATDALGQTGVSDTVSMVLPEREFSHPIARAVIEQRKILVIAPEERELVAENIDAIADQTDEYSGDLTVFLALKMARSRLFNDRTGDQIASVQQLLWDTALRLEDGGLSLAERRLRELQQELAEALANGAPDEEIERLMDELQQAMDEFLRELAEASPLLDPEQMEQLQMMMPQDPSEIFTSQDLQEMLDQLRELSESGAREEAQRLLSELQRLMENMQPMPFQMSPQMSEQMEMMGDLNGLVQRQQALRDETYQSGQRLPDPGGRQEQGPDQEPPPSATQQLAPDQEELRLELGEIMREFGDMVGEIPDSLGLAERAMNEATEALEGDMPGPAGEAQQEALDHLQQGMNDMAQMMAEQGMMALGRQRQPYGPGNRPAQRDPLGRAAPEDRGLDTGDVEIPDQMDLQRAREILDELRRRAGEAFRSRDELDYIDRLLRQF